MKQSIISLPNPRKNTNVKKSSSTRQGKRTGLTPGKFLFYAGVFAITVPIFRSGLKSNLTFFEFVMNHTIFGDPVEYLPREDYETIFSELEP